MITVDKRIGSLELMPHFPYGVARRGHLEYGDAAFLGNGPDGPAFIGVERKGIHDLISSIDSGRLTGHQLPGLLRSYSYVYLVVEGLWRVGEHGILETWWKGKPRWKPMAHGNRLYMASMVHNFLNTLMVKSGVLVYRTDNLAHTASLILDLSRWWGKEWEKHYGNVGFATSPHPAHFRGKPGLLQRIAKEMEGVGWERSMAVAAHFGSVQEMILAEEEDWRKVEGIGKTLSKRIVKSIRGE